MTRRVSLPALVGCMLAMIAVSTVAKIAMAGEAYDLRYDLEEGATFKILTLREHQKVQEVMGNPVETRSRDSIDCSFSVKTANEKGMKIEVTYGKRSHWTDDQRFGVPVDFSELAGKKAVAHLSPNGQVSNFMASDDLPMIEIPDENQTLNEQSYIRELEDLFTVTAGRPVTIGEEWTHLVEYDVPLQGGMLLIRLDYRYRIVEQTRRNGFECLRLAGTVEIAGAGHMEVSGMALDVTFAGNGQETVYFATEPGFFLEVESDTALSGKAGSEEMGLTIPFQETYQTEITVSS